MIPLYGPPHRPVTAPPHRFTAGRPASALGRLLAWRRDEVLLDVPAGLLRIGPGAACW